MGTELNPSLHCRCWVVLHIADPSSSWVPGLVSHGTGVTVLARLSQE